MWTSETTYIKNCRRIIFLALWSFVASWRNFPLCLVAWSRREMENRFLNIFLSLIERESEESIIQLRNLKASSKKIKISHPETVSILITLIHSLFAQLWRSLRNFPENLSGKDTEMMNHNCWEFPVNYPSNFHPCSQSRSELWWSINNYWITHRIAY